MKQSAAMVQKLWSLSNVLRDDGMVYHQYMTELTYLLFLKMAAETKTEHLLPDGYRWKDLLMHNGEDQLGFYRKMLTHLGEDSQNEVVRQIFAFPTTVFKHWQNLQIVVQQIDALEWYSTTRDGFGDIYEGLLAKNAVESKSGAGQYFTPRALIETIVEVMQPTAEEVIQDPAAGTGGFLISADKYIRAATPARCGIYEGIELVQDTHRLCLMNLFVHGITGNVACGDALSSDFSLQPADVVLTNPPFGSKKGGGRPVRDDLHLRTNNKQMLFLQHVYQGLKLGGRAAVVVPDNVLFEEGAGTRLREELMTKCNLHTILRLPVGIFYAPGVKTNVLFFTRGESDSAATEELWIYDLRTNSPRFGKRNPLTRAYFADFVRVFGSDPHGASHRADEGPSGRFRCFPRSEIQGRGFDLNILWLREASTSPRNELLDLESMVADVISRLHEAVADMEEFMSVLSADPGEGA